MLIWDSGYLNLISFLKEQKEIPFLICDENTYEACGKYIEESLKKEKLEYDKIILKKDAHADEKNICKVLVSTRDNSLIVSVGSGSITDISRFIAYKQKLRFISIPTAPSMDGYASSVAPLTIDGLKTTVNAIPPEKIFIDINILERSPRILKIAGFGDMMGKFTALLDWQISNLLTDESIDFEVIEEMQKISEEILLNVDKKEFLRLLTYGLIRSGELMAKVGSSRPASGSEHHVAHFLEYLGYNTPYHGIKVGIATLYILRLYERFLELKYEDIERLINYKIDEEKWKKEIREVFHRNYEKIIAENSERIRKINNDNYRKEFINRLKNKKEDIINIIEKVILKKTKILEGYEKIGFSCHPQDWNISLEDFKKALLYSLYIRERFTILSLYQFLGILNNEIEKIL
jgi:glycerol-1-phosphate dehydrogenase [NAD(P)+]